MQKWSVASTLALASLGAALCFAPHPVHGQPVPMAKINIYDQANNVINDKNKIAEVPVTVTLFSQGEPVRNTTFSNASGHAIINWNQLPAGPYEVHFEARGFGKVIKRVILTGGNITDVVFDTLTKSDEVWGPGPSLFELQSRIVELEKANGLLKDKVTALEKEVAAQKK